MDISKTQNLKLSKLKLLFLLKKWLRIKLSLRVHHLYNHRPFVWIEKLTVSSLMFVNIFII